MEKPKKCVQQDWTKGQALKRGALIIFVWVTIFLGVISFLMESRWDLISSNLSLLVMAIAMLSQPLKARDFVLVTHQSAKTRTDQQEAENIMAIEGGGLDSNEYRHEYINKESIAQYKSGDLDLDKKLSIEKRLIDLCQSCDPYKIRYALEIIYHRHSKAVNKVAISKEVFADVWVKAMEKLKDPEQFVWQGKPLEHWFRSVTTKTNKEHHRNQKTRRKKDISIDEISQDKICTYKTPEKELMEKEEQQERDQQAIKACNMLNNEWERMIITQKYFKGMSNKQIAEELGKPENTIRAYHSRAIKKLRKYFK